MYILKRIAIKDSPCSLLVKKGKIWQTLKAWLKSLKNSSLLLVLTSKKRFPKQKTFSDYLKLPNLETFVNLEYVG